MRIVAIPSASTESKSSAWLRTARLPAISLATVGVVLLVALIAAQAVRGFTDPDYWWHFKTGEYIVSHHAIPRVDIFTSTGLPWTTHEWLSEAVIYLLVHLGGYGLALAVFTMAPVLAVLLMYRLARREGVSERAALPVTALAALMIALYTTVRPQVLAWAFFALLLTAIYGYRSGRVHRLWLLPFLFGFWANLHLSFLIGLGILALFVAAEGAQQWIEKRPLRIGVPLATLGACAAAACVNPIGPRLFAYPIRYVALQRTQFHAALAEWKTPDFHSYIFLPLLVALLVLLTTGVAGRQPDLWTIGLAVVTVGLALQSVRYVPIFAIVFVPLAGVALAERWAWARDGATEHSSARRSLVHLCMLCAVFGVFALAVRPGTQTQLSRSPLTSGQLVPVQAVDTIQARYPDGRIFNQYEWGGYLIYRLWPSNRPFVDGREEMFDPKFLEEYLRTYVAETGWQDALDRRGVNLVIVRADSSMAGALETNPRWQLAEKDDLAVVYVRE